MRNNECWSVCIFGWEPGEMQRDIIQIMTLFLLQYKNLQSGGGKGGGEWGDREEENLQKLDERNYRWHWLTVSSSNGAFFIIIISALFPDRMKWLELRRI